MLRVGGLTCDATGICIYLSIYSFQGSVYSKSAKAVYDTGFEVP